MQSRAGKRGRAVLFLAACPVLVGAGVAYATGGIPGSNGVIQGCYDNGGNVKVVADLSTPARGPRLGPSSFSPICGDLLTPRVGLEPTTLRLTAGCSAN